MLLAELLVVQVTFAVVSVILPLLTLVIVKAGEPPAPSVMKFNEPALGYLPELAYASFELT
jgi:hypothetical protein